CRRQLAAGNGQAEVVVGRRPDRQPVLVRGVEPLARQHLRRALEVLVAERLGECNVGGLHRRSELVLRRGPDLDHHELRSSGAWSSMRRRSLPPGTRTVTTPPASICVTTPSPSVPCRTESPVESDGTSSRGVTPCACAPYDAHDVGRNRSRSTLPGSSSRKREGRLYPRAPQSERDDAWVSAGSSSDRVMPTQRS